VKLTSFPRRALRGDAELFRIHRRERDAWWFSSDGSGRFDPVGTGLGACYFATDPLGAWVEVFRDNLLLDGAEVIARSLGRTRLGRHARLADLTSRRALQFGVTASLGADRDYAESHAFAARAAMTGFAGIRYFVRHDRAQKLYGIALFGDPGAVGRSPAWPPIEDGPIPNELVDAVRRTFGYQILPLPAL
jgi:RES domain